MSLSIPSKASSHCRGSYQLNDRKSSQRFIGSLQSVYIAEELTNGELTLQRNSSVVYCAGQPKGTNQTFAGSSWPARVAEEFTIEVMQSTTCSLHSRCIPRRQTRIEWSKGEFVHPMSRVNNFTGQDLHIVLFCKSSAGQASARGIRKHDHHMAR